MEDHLLALDSDFLPEAIVENHLDHTFREKRLHYEQSAGIGLQNRLGLSHNMVLAD